MQLSTKKKSQVKTISPRFHSKKTMLLAAIIVILLLFLSHNYFLSDKNVRPNGGKTLLSKEQAEPGVIVTQIPDQNVNQQNDIYFGPLQLKNSSYISDKLDTYVKENNSSPSSSSDEDLSNESIANKSQFSFGNFIAHPIATIAEMSDSFIADYTNNGRRTTLIKLVDAVSRYYVTYNKFPLDGAQVDNSYDWVDEMVDKNEVSGVYSYVLEKTSPVSYCGSVEQTGYCFGSNGQDAIVYVQLDQSITDPICGEKSLVFLWSSADNKLGDICMDSAPNGLSGFDFLKD